jgi:hypothetical protein
MLHDRARPSTPSVAAECDVLRLNRDEVTIIAINHRISVIAPDDKPG